MADGAEDEAVAGCCLMSGAEVEGGVKVKSTLPVAKLLEAAAASLYQHVRMMKPRKELSSSDVSAAAIWQCGDEVCVVAAKSRELGRFLAAMRLCAEKLIATGKIRSQGSEGGDDVVKADGAEPLSCRRRHRRSDEVRKAEVPLMMVAEGRYARRSSQRSMMMLLVQDCEGVCVSPPPPPKLQ